MTTRKVKTQKGGDSFVLDDSLVLNGGSEGEIYRVSGKDSIAIKIYRKKVDNERVNKLTAMVANAPNDPMRSKGHASIAWPTDLVVSDANAEVCGFVMPRLRNGHLISTFYNFKLRQADLPFITYQSLCRLGSNLASAVWAIHDKGYVIGDVNDTNIMATADALVTIVDTDSFQIKDPNTGHVYRCPVFTPFYTAPEFQGVPPLQADRKPEHDLFGIGVLIFQLLMEGRYPFVGAVANTSNHLEGVQCLRRGYFPYGKQENGITPPPGAVPYETLHPTLRRLFNQCFLNGYQNPRMRPTAETWYRTLRDCEDDLVECSVNSQHLYFKHLNACHWCEQKRRVEAIKKQGNWDPFPPRPASAGSRSSNKGTQWPLPRPSPPPPARPTSPPVRPTPPPPLATPIPTLPPSVTPKAPPSPVSFTASATSITPGQPITFQWTVPNANRVQLKERWGHVVYASNSPNGSATVWPTKSKTYRLSASDLNINLPPPIKISVIQQVPDALNEIAIELRAPIELQSTQLALRQTLPLKQPATPLLSPMPLKEHLKLNGYQPLNDVTVDLNYAQP